VSTNPFHYETPADRWSFFDREDVLPTLKAFFGERGRRLLIVGRRRMGKTSLITNAAREAKAVMVFADLSKAASLNEVAKALVGQIPGPSRKANLHRILDLVGRFAKYVSLKGRVFALEVSLVPKGAAEDLTALDQVLDFINALAEETDTPYTVCLDEFQEIRTLGGDRAEWTLRGTIQHHRTLNYVFSGSDQRLLGWMTEPKAAFYKQLQVLSMGAIPPGVIAAWIDKRTREAGISAAPFGADVVAAAGPCTGDIVRLAHEAFVQAAGCGKVDVARSMKLIALGELGAVFVLLWRALPLTQRAILRAIAAGRPPQARRTLHDYGLGGTSTVSTAINGLIERQLLTREEGRLVFDNPFFRLWVSANSPADGGSPQR
jgi:hypothetical protein